MLVADGGGLEGEDALDGVGQSRKEKRKALKKQKRKQARRELAIREREEEEARANDPEEQLCIRLREQEEAEVVERERKAFEERERLWLEAAAACRAEEERKEEEARRERLVEESLENEVKETNEFGEGDDWEYVEEGPAEIIWKGNEIIVKKKRVRVKKGVADKGLLKEADDRPTSNPLPPQSVAFEAFNSLPPASAQEALESVAQQVPNFGTEQDKAHCPFHLKTGACRFGMRCSRVHFYPDKSCTLLIKNMYNGPGIAWEQDEGLEVCMIMPNVADVYTDEEVECCYEEFYEDVHTEFLKFGELINFKACRNSSFHLRGNVYIHYKNLESASLAYNTMNGRYYGGKQITCEFVNITRWKTAICGEYMKSRLKTCSHGTACNFIHCFYNPGGDYEWADWDNPPPRYWVKKMAVLFGPSDGPRQDMDVGLENQPPKESGKKRTRKSDSYHSRRDRYKETVLSGSSGGEGSDGNRDRRRSRGRYSHYERRSYSRERRKAFGFADKLEQSRGGHFPEADRYEYSRDSYDSGNDMLKVNDGGSHKERESMEGSCIEDYEEHARKHKSDSSSRSTRKTTVDRVGKSEKKSKDHGQRKRADLPDSDNVNHKVEDGYKKDGHASNKANYKNVSDADEHHSDRPSSVDLYSEKEISHKKDRRPRSEHRSHRHKHHNETRYNRQDAEGDGSSPVESLDDRTKGATEFRRMRGKCVHRRRSRSPCPSDLDDSGNSGSSGGSSYERKSKRPISKRRRHHRKRDHNAVRGDDGDSASDGMGLESGRSKQHRRWTPGPPI